MRGLARLRHLWTNLVHRDRVDRDLNDELAAAFDAAAGERIQAGLDPVEARRLTALELGRADAIVTQIRQARAGGSVESVWHDLVFGARLLRRDPLFTATALLSLGLGIGITTTVFSLVNALLLRDLAVADPQALVEVGRTTPSGRGTAFSYPGYVTLRDGNTVFSGLLALSKNTVNGVAAGSSTPAAGRYVSGNFFEVLGVAPAAGRLLSARDDRLDDPAVSAVAVLSHRFWQRAFGGADVLGQRIRVDAVSFTIAGVTSPAFDDLVVGRGADFFVPMAGEALVRRDSRLRSAASNWIGIVGRLRPGVSPAAAQAGLEPAFAAFLADVAAETPDVDVQRRIRAQRIFVQPASNGVSDIRRDVARPMLLLMGAVSLVLLIACANVVNLLLARGESRRREIAMRLAIGASRARVVRQLITESALLGAAGAAVGLGIAAVGSPVLLSLMSQGGTPIDLDVRVDRTVLLFTIGIALVSSLVAGLVPALRSARNGPRSGLTPLQDGARTLRVSRESTRWGYALIGVQVALSLALVTGTSLLAVTLRNIHGFHPGFDARPVVLFNLDPTRVGYEGDALAQYYRDVLDAVRATPGVAAASVSKVTPISGSGIDKPMAIDGRPRERDVAVVVNRVSDGFFSTMSIPLLTGRDLAPPGMGAIVNETFARKYFPGANPIGRRLALGDDPPQEIVGVVANSKYSTLRDADVPTVYVFLVADDPGTTLSVRTSGDPLAFAGTIATRVQEVGPRVPVSRPRTLTSQVERSLTSERFIARLLGAFAAVALLLACVGLYGVLGYSVSRRTAEIGLRLALGASPVGVLRSVLRQSLAVVVSGLAIGLPVTLWLLRPIQTLLFGVEPADPRVLGGAAASLALVALVAAAVPALRAARVDPLIALRRE